MKYRTSADNDPSASANNTAAAPAKNPAANSKGKKNKKAGKQKLVLDWGIKPASADEKLYDA